MSALELIYLLSTTGAVVLFGAGFATARAWFSGANVSSRAADRVTTDELHAELQRVRERLHGAYQELEELDSLREARRQQSLPVRSAEGVDGDHVAELEYEVGLLRRENATLNAEVGTLRVEHGATELLRNVARNHRALEQDNERLAARVKELEAELEAARSAVDPAPVAEAAETDELRQRLAELEARLVELGGERRLH